MLLVLNLIAVAGFVLFLAKCRPIAVRSGDAFHEIRPRAEAANLSAHSASPIQDAVLKRLSLLEDIVYRQLNGKDARWPPRVSARAGGWRVSSRGSVRSLLGGRHLMAPALSLLPSLSRVGQEEKTAGKNDYLLHFRAPAVSLVLSWKRVSAVGSWSPRARQEMIPW